MPYGKIDNMVKFITNLLKALNANVNPAEIAHAFACGTILGLMPKDNLLWYLVFVFILFVRINKPAYLIMTLIGAAISPAFDGLFDTVGYAFLTIPALSGLSELYWTFPSLHLQNSTTLWLWALSSAESHFTFLFTFWEDSLFTSGVNMQQTLSVIQKLQRLSTKFL